MLMGAWECKMKANIGIGRKLQSPVNNKEEVKVDRKIIIGDEITTAPANTFSTGNPVIHFPNNESYKGFDLDEEILSKHLLLLGGIGSGKTNTFYHLIGTIKERMTKDDIMFIFDSKGDYKELFYDSNNRNHILIGSNPCYQSITYCWDLFGELTQKNGIYDERESMLTAKEIAKQMFSGRESSIQPFFTNASADIVSKIMIYLLRHNKATELSTNKLVEYIKNTSAVSLHNMLVDEKDFKNAATYLGIRSNEKGAYLGLGDQGQGVLGTINSMVNDLLVGPFAEDYGSHKRISMRELVKNKGKKIVFIEYDIALGETLGPIYRILFDLVLKEALGGREQSGNVYLFMDELSLAPNMLHLQNGLNFGRSKNVKIIAGLQSITQLHDIYGQSRGDVIAAGFMNSFCFQTWDLSSRRFVSERFGDNYQHITYWNKGEHFSHQREGRVVEDWDIIDLEVGEAFINLASKKPVRFKYKFKKYI